MSGVPRRPAVLVAYPGFRGRFHSKLVALEFAIKIRPGELHHKVRVALD